MKHDIDELGLRVLRAFDALMSERNVTRAAARLGLTQQGLSGQLSRMRGFFDDPLFVRSNNAMNPTPFAEALWPRVHTALESLDKLSSSREFDPSQLDTTIGIAASDYAIALLLPRLLAAFRETAPRLRVAVFPAQSVGLVEAMRTGQIQLALTVPEFTPPDLKSLKLLRDEYVGTVRRDHTLARSDVDVDDFCHWPHLLVSPYRGDFHGPVDDALARLGRQREIALVVPGFSVVPSLLDATDLVATLPRRLLASFSRPLHTFDLPLDVPGFDLCVTWPSWKDADALSLWLRAICFDVAHGLPAS